MDNKTDDSVKQYILFSTMKTQDWALRTQLKQELNLGVQES
jgi:hypothetical protein